MFIYFGCTNSQFQHSRSSIFAVAYGIFFLVAACELLVVAYGIYFPNQRLNPDPPALGAKSLSHWTPNEVPLPIFFNLFIFY